MTKEMGQIYRQTCFEPVSIKQLTPQDKIRAQEAIMILDQKSTTINPNE